MNKNNKNKSDFLKENGLIISLYGVVGVLVVTAGVLTVRTIEPTPMDLQSEPVNSSITQSYNQGEIGLGVYTDTPNYVENIPADEVPNTSKENKEVEEDVDKKEISKQQSEKNLDSFEKEVEEKANDADDQTFNFDPKLNMSATQIEEMEASDSAKLTQPIDEVATVAMYTAFNDGEKMQWPVTGEVVLPYSNVLAIYDPTLDQFRTNELVSISSNVGTEVKASAEGQVLEVSNNEVSGNYVTIQHGNGWTTSYGQLDGVTVRSGDVVRAGQIIGKIAEPTKYSVALGEHVDFRVAQNDKAINPMNILAN